MDILGHYNPSSNPVLLDIDKKKYEDWKRKGAMSTSAVEKLVEGKYEFIPYTRQNESEAKKETATAAPSVEPAAEAEQPAAKDEAANSSEATE